MTLHTFGPADVGRKYHVAYPTPKHDENSLKGTRWAANHGYDTTDIDLLVDKTLHDAAVHTPMSVRIPIALIAGHIRAEHWPEPLRKDGFHDPKGILHRDDPMHEMEDFEIDRLVARNWFHGRYATFHIPTVEQQMHLCREVHIKALWEPKRSPAWMRPEVWEYLSNLAASTGCHSAVYSLMHECLPLAQNVGFKAWAIN